MEKIKELHICSRNTIKSQIFSTSFVMSVVENTLAINL